MTRGFIMTFSHHIWIRNVAVILKRFSFWKLLLRWLTLSVAHSHFTATASANSGNIVSLPVFMKAFSASENFSFSAKTQTHVYEKQLLVCWKHYKHGRELKCGFKCVLGLLEQ